MSMQATSFPGNLSWSVGTVATGLAAVDWIAALGLVPALLAWHAARMRRATIAPIAPFRGVRSILVLHGPLRAVHGQLGVGAIYCSARRPVEVRRPLASLR